MRPARTRRDEPDARRPDRADADGRDEAPTPIRRSGRGGRRRRRRADEWPRPRTAGAHPDPPAPARRGGAAGGPPRGPRAATAGRRPGRRRPASVDRRPSCAAWVSRSRSSRSSSSCSSSASGVDLWTDAIWYKSVGFDASSGPASAPRSGCSPAGLVVALVVLLGNLLLAGRLAPPADPARPGRLRSIADRLGEAQRQAERSARMAGGQFRGPFGGPFGGPRRRGRTRGGHVQLRARGHARPRPAREVGDRRVRRAARARRRGRRVRGLGHAAAVDQPRPVLAHRDGRRTRSSGRTSASSCSSCRSSGWCSRWSTGCCWRRWPWPARGTSSRPRDGGEVFITRVRVHLAVLAGLYLLSVAFGYQLDKYELVYSSAGVATGVSFTDANARFMAYDVLTFLSGLAGALLVAGAFTRWLWPLGADRRRLVRRLDRARPAVPGGDPAVHRGSEHVRPGGALHREQHRDDAARLRHRPVGIEAVQGRPAADAGGHRHRGGHVRERAPVGLPPAPDDPRPAPDRAPVLRLRGRGHGSLHDQRHDAPGDAVGARARDREEPLGHELGQRADHLHPRDRAGHGAGQRGHARGPAAAVDPRPAARVDQRRADGHRAPDLLRRERRPLRRGRVPARPSSTIRATPAPAAPTRRRRGPGRPASASIRRSRDCCSRSASRTWTC